MVLTVSIGRLFDYAASLGVSFPNDEFVDVPFEIYLPNEKWEWVLASKFIKKTATVHEVAFQDGSSFKAADKHKLSVDGDADLFVFVKDLVPGLVISYANKVVAKNEPVGIENVYGVQIESPKHAYKTPDGLVHHNTYSCKKAAEKGVKRHPNGAKLVVTSGDVGSSPSDVLFQLWKYRHNYVLLLDDCDSMLKSKSQTVANVLKAALDPDMKPVAAGGYAVRKIIQNKIDADPELNPSGLSKKEQLKLAKQQREKEPEVDREAAAAKAERLKRAIEDEKLDVGKKTERLPAKTGQLKWVWKNGTGVLIQEATEEDVEFVAPMTIEQKEEAKVFDIDQEFVFDSSIVFISNLDFDDVNSAVRDRCLPAEIRLSREEFMVRLEVVLDGLCKEDKTLSTLSQEKLDWAKKNAYSMLKALVEAERDGTPLFKDKKKVVINRQLTFRSIDDLVSVFLNVEKVLEKTKPGFADIVDPDERAKAMTYQFARESVEYLSAVVSA